MTRRRRTRRRGGFHPALGGSLWIELRERNGLIDEQHGDIADDGVRQGLILPHERSVHAIGDGPPGPVLEAAQLDRHVEPAQDEAQARGMFDQGLKYS